MKKEEIYKEIIYDCIVIGTGTSSEPVLFIIENKSKYYRN